MVGKGLTTLHSFHSLLYARFSTECTTDYSMDSISMHKVFTSVLVHASVSVSNLPSGTCVQGSMVAVCAGCIPQL